MIELQTVTTKAKNPSTNEFQDVTWGGINVLSTSGTTNYNNLTNKPTINGVTVQGSLTTGDLLITAADVGALPSGTKYGADFALSIDSQTFVVTAQLKDQDGNNLGQAKTIDLPLETMVVSGSYDDTTQKIILTLKNGQTVEFSVADLVSGLQSEITLNNKLDADLVSDVSSENKFVTAAEKAAWNGKQNTISDLSTIRSGAAAGATALQQSDVTSTYSASGTAPVNGTAVNAALGTLDVSSVGGAGKYISAISETNGKIAPVEGTIDSVPTASSANPVSSGGVQTPLAEVIDNGAKNLLKITATSQTITGVTFTVGNDGTVTANGTNTGTSAAIFQIANVSSAGSRLATGRYVISGCTGGSSSTFDLRFYRNSDGSVIPNYAGGTQFEYTSGAWNVSILVRAGKTVDATFKPMVCTYADYAVSPTFVPYRPSWQEMWDMIQALQNNS